MLYKIIWLIREQPCFLPIFPVRKWRQRQQEAEGPARVAQPITSSQAAARREGRQGVGPKAGKGTVYAGSGAPARMASAWFHPHWLTPPPLQVPPWKALHLPLSHLICLQGQPPERFPGRGFGHSGPQLPPPALSLPGQTRLSPRLRGPSRGVSCPSLPFQGTPFPDPHGRVGAQRVLRPSRKGGCL